MKKQMRQLKITSAILWAAAMIAAAIMKAPVFFTIVLLPMLAFSSLAAIQRVGRREDASSGFCS
jgi:hypothetical protein